MKCIIVVIASNLHVIATTTILVAVEPIIIKNTVIKKNCNGLIRIWVYTIVIRMLHAIEPACFWGITATYRLTFQQSNWEYTVFINASESFTTTTWGTVPRHNVSSLFGRTYHW